MTVQTKLNLKQMFVHGDTQTQRIWTDLIDSMFSSLDTATFTLSGTEQFIITSDATTSTVFPFTCDSLTTGTGIDGSFDALTSGTGLSLTSSSVITTNGELLLCQADAATTSAGIVRVSATGLTTGWVAKLTGGGATATAAGGVLNISAGAATLGTALAVSTTGAYVGATGVISLTATNQVDGDLMIITGGGAGMTAAASLLHLDGTGATVGLMLDIQAASLTTGSALNINAGSGIAINATAGNIVFGGTATRSGAGAIPITQPIAELTSTGADAMTIANGIEGQRLTCIHVSDGGSCVIAPASAEYTNVTLLAAGDSVDFIFTNGKWYIIGVGAGVGGTQPVVA